MHRHQVGAVDPCRQDLLFLEVGWDEDVGVEPCRRGVRRYGVSQVPGRGAGQRVEPELAGPGQRDRHHAVLERVRGIGGIVLDPYFIQAKLIGQAVGAQQRREPRRERPGLLSDREEVGVAPQRLRPGLDPATELRRIRVRPRRVSDLERPEALLADVPRI